MEKPIKIAFVGGPGSGKSLTMAAIYVELKKRGFSAFMTEEGAAHFIRFCGKPHGLAEGFVIAYLQKKNEDEMTIQGADFLLCDCATFLTYPYSRRNEQKYKNKKRYNFLLRLIWEFYRETFSSYDFIFFSPIEHDFNPADGIRYQSREEAEDIGRQIKAFLDSEKIKYFEARGSLEERIKQVLEVLKIHKVV